ncbi:hypothetical protein BGZ50_001468 [Haplosporangium sp. Z 11]|nr:hypothetical protein BGZ50_001468 [Haplosporangium sp. Z 11]
MMPSSSSAKNTPRQESSGAADPPLTVPTPPDPAVSTPSERIAFNLKYTYLLKCPPEVLRHIFTFLTDPLDLLHFTHASSLLLEQCTSMNWFALFQFHQPSWGLGCKIEDEEDWKAIVLKDCSLKRRLTAPRHAPSENAAGTEASITNNQQSNTSARLRIPLVSAQNFPSDTATAEGDFRRIASPIYNIDSASNTTIAASMVTRSRARPTTTTETATPTPIPLEEGDTDRQILLYLLPDLTNPLAKCGSEFWTAPGHNSSVSWHHPIPAELTQIAQIIDVKHYPISASQPNAREMRVVIVMAFGENAAPLTQDGNELQILDIWRLIRVIEVWIPMISFGTQDASQSLVESFGLTSSSSVGSGAWVNHTPVTCARPRMGRVETIILSPNNENAIRGRMVKLYSAPMPTISSQDEAHRAKEFMQNKAQVAQDMHDATGFNSDVPLVDCIAVFGIQNGARETAVVEKKILFLEDKALARASWSRKPITQGVSCMSLFCYHSNYERMLVMFNRRGRGMIWDWVNERHVAHLYKHRPPVGNNEKKSQEESAQAPTQVQPVPVERPNLYYWGVQVSWAAELPLRPRTDPNQRSSFRITILADGIGSEWESSWWHVDSDMLGHTERDLEAPPFVFTVDKKTPAVVPAAKTAPPAELYAVKTRYEAETLGFCQPEQLPTHAEEDGKPLSFIAYLIWNHYRIGLSTTSGISMTDLEEGEVNATQGQGSETVKDWQWVTFLDNKEEDPLVDIATFGDNLVITRRHGHLVWPLHGRKR